MKAKLARYPELIVLSVLALVIAALAQPLFL